jgi:hypothetical protein
MRGLELACEFGGCTSASVVVLRAHARTSRPSKPTLSARALITSGSDAVMRSSLSRAFDCSACADACRLRGGGPPAVLGAAIASEVDVLQHSVPECFCDVSEVSKRSSSSSFSLSSSLCGDRALEPSLALAALTGDEQVLRRPRRGIPAVPGDVAMGHLPPCMCLVVFG